MTPTFNSSRYLAESIESVLAQSGDFCVEYIFVDNFSTDDTLKIIQLYQQKLLSKKINIRCNDIVIKIISEKDKGMYDALAKGFSVATGDVFAWINSDDIYLPGAFNTVKEIFLRYAEISWLKGVTSYIDIDSNRTERGKNFLYNRAWIRKGLYGRLLYFIQQDSVFWRKSLYFKTPGIDRDLKLAGDYDLWLKFAQHTPLYSIDQEFSCFRKRAGQLSENLKDYFKECDRLSKFNRLLLGYLFFVEKICKSMKNSLIKKIITVALFLFPKYYEIIRQCNNKFIVKRNWFFCCFDYARLKKYE